MTSAEFTDGDSPDQVVPNITAPVVPNPVQQAFNVTVVVPAQISIRMVDASTLADYEYHVFAASLFCSAAVGFLVPCVQEFRSNGDLAIPFLFFSLLLIVLFIGAGSIAISKRRKLLTTGKEIKLTTTGATV
jgi:hypothetical protein